MNAGLTLVVVLNMALALAGLIVGVESLVAIKRTRLQVRRLLVESVAGVKAERRETIGKLQGISATLAAAQGSDDSYGRSETQPWESWKPRGRTELVERIKAISAPIPEELFRCACGMHIVLPNLGHFDGKNRKHTQTVCER